MKKYHHLTPEERFHLVLSDSIRDKFKLLMARPEVEARTTTFHVDGIGDCTALFVVGNEHSERLIEMARGLFENVVEIIEVPQKKRPPSPPRGRNNRHGKKS